MKHPEPITLGHALSHQLMFGDGECMGEKINRIYRPEPLLAPRKVSLEDFERDMK
jgi:hypothetical protein